MTDTLDGESQARLSLATILPFSVVSLPLSAIGIAVFVYLPPYFASHLGVSMVTVGAVWGTVRLIDIPVDVILALMMDRTRTRIGRYRPWLIGGAPILMAALYFLFMAPRGVGAGYLVGGLLAMYLGASIVGLAHAAWSATLATRYHERSRLFGVNTAVGVAGALGVLMIPILGRQFGLGDVQGVQGMGWAIIALIPLTVGLAAIRTPERATRNVRGPGFALRD